MTALAEAELEALGPKIEELERQLKVQLLPKDEADEKSAILELRAGTGGEEAALFAGDLFRMDRGSGLRFDQPNLSAPR